MSFLIEELITIDADVVTAKQAIEYAGDLLEKYGYVKKGYAKAVWEREQQYPTGLKGERVGFAIPHTNPKYTIKAGMALIVPRQPVEFGVMATIDQKVNCNIIMPLVIENPEEQIAFLGKIMEILKDQSTLQKIINAGDPKEILKLMQRVNQ